VTAAVMRGENIVILLLVGSALDMPSLGLVP